MYEIGSAVERNRFGHNRVSWSSDLCVNRREYALTRQSNETELDQGVRRTETQARGYHRADRWDRPQQSDVVLACRGHVTAAKFRVSLAAANGERSRSLTFSVRTRPGPSAGHVCKGLRSAAPRRTPAATILWSNSGHGYVMWRWWRPIPTIRQPPRLAFCRLVTRRSSGAHCTKAAQTIPALR